MPFGGAELSTRAKMGSHHLTVICVLFLACHITIASIFEPVTTKSCKCLQRKFGFIRREKCANVEVFPAGLTCKNKEVIITLKQGNKKVCVNPERGWVQQLVRNVNEVSVLKCNHV